MKIVVQARPGAKEEKVEKVGDLSFKVSVKELPRQGRANAAIVRVLAEYFGVSQSQVRIISGQTIKNKIVEIV